MVANIGDFRAENICFENRAFLYKKKKRKDNSYSLELGKKA